MYLKQRGGEHDGEGSHQLVLTLLLNLNARTQRQEESVDEAKRSEITAAWEDITRRQLCSLCPLTSHLFGLPEDLLQEDEEVLGVPPYQLLQAPAVH